MTGLPLSADKQMPPPGIRRRDFASLYTTRVSGAPDDFFASGDSKSDYQQYSDHIRATHYRNPVRLTTCTGCHNPHVNADEVAEMDSVWQPQCRVYDLSQPGGQPGALSPGRPRRERHRLSTGTRASSSPWPVRLYAVSHGADGQVGCRGSSLA